MRRIQVNLGQYNQAIRNPRTSHAVLRGLNVLEALQYG
jgi:hypothetical protein